jgi:Uma2 family endonuclease
MVQYNPRISLPTEFDLPDSDNKPVDNELQLLVPILLRLTLEWLWEERTDWFLGINMGIYYDTDLPAIVPDAFLSLGVPRVKREQGRLSYVTHAENNVMPIWVLEVVSQTKGGEYDDKMQSYAGLGVLYYTIYNPHYWRRDEHAPFEVYRLIDGSYVQQPRNPLWIPELGLGIGTGREKQGGWSREWLYWFDRDGTRYLPPQNLLQHARQQIVQERQRAEQERQRAEQERQRAEQERQRAEQMEQQLEQERQQAEQERRSHEELLDRLRAQGINVDDLL